MDTEVSSLNDEQIRELERTIAEQKRERKLAKWDAELVGRYFRVVRVRESGLSALFGFHSKSPCSDYVTLEESLAVGQDAERYVYADVSYVHIKGRKDEELTCSGFQVSHTDRKEPYLKIQPVFYSWDDFRNYLNSWSMHSGPAKHCDEVSKAEYDEALQKAVSNFTGLCR